MQKHVFEMNQATGLGRLETKKLQIICADDMYYNLETLRLVFQKLNLI